MRIQRLLPFLSSRSRSTRAALLLGAVVAALSCAGEGTGPEVVATVQVTPSTATVSSRAPLPLAAAPKTAAGKVVRGGAVSWSSSDTAIAKVSATGLVTAGAVLGGVALPVQVTATAGGVSGSATLTVTPVPVAVVTPSPPSATIATGATQQFATALVDDLALALSGRTVTWTSSDTTIATVDATGLATARPYEGGAVRTATITAHAEGRSGSAALTIQPLAVAMLSIAPESVAVEDTRLLSATLRDGAGTPLSGRAITWSSSDTTVAHVNGAGLAIPVERWDNTVRTVTVTATSEGISGSTVLTVLPARVGSISITPGGSSLPSRAIATLSAVPRTISGIPLAGRPVSWVSSDSSVLSVDADGLVHATVVTGATAVPVTITAISEGFSSSATFSVLPSPVASISVVPDSVALRPRTTRPLSHHLWDSELHELTGRLVTWSSLDSSLISVSASGVLSAPEYLGSDTAFTAVVASSEGVADTITVVRLPSAVLRLTLFPTTLIMPVGSTQRISTLMRDALDDVLTGRPITWGSSDSSIATVSDSGVISMLTSGEVEITATVDGVTATVGVTPLPVTIVPSTLVAGGEHSCGLTSTGAAYCWGWNAYGQLGNGTNVSTYTPVPVAGGITFQHLAAGIQHTCGVATNGTAYCWGWNAYGQLGDSSTTHHLVPVPVKSVDTFASVTAGFFHSCGRTSAGVAYCWGRNNSAQLGDGTEIDRHAPVEVTGGNIFTMITGRNSHTCGLAPSGAAYCWGRNNHTALGDSTIIRRSTPVPVLGGRFFSTLVAGWDHTCGIELGTGISYCLGRNQFGQLGTGSLVDHPGFTEVVAIPLLRDLSTGYYHLCGISFDDRLFCWGRNHARQIGDGTFLDRPTPLQIEPNERFLAIAGSYSHACGIVQSGVVHCWGLLSGGALGDAAPVAPSPLTRFVGTPWARAGDGLR